MNIGVLYPRSKEHPGITANFVDGIKIATRLIHENNINMFSESIGLGGMEKEVYEKAEKLLLLDDVDILVAYIDLRVLEILEPLLFTTGKLCIVVNPGANYPQNWIPKPNIIFLTLQHAFLCSMTGSLAVTAANEKALMATTFYDCGYLHTAAMVKAFTESGGAIIFNDVNKALYDDSFQINAITDFLIADQSVTDLLCVYDEVPASLLYNRLNSFEEAASLQLFVSPMMLSERALENLSANNKFSIAGFLPWLASSTAETNDFFKTTFLSQTKRTADIFALLGWETGLIINQVIKNCNDFYKDGAKVATTLKDIKIEGPRGELQLDTATHYFISPVVKCTVENNKPVFQILDIPAKEWKAFSSIPLQGVNSGWTNTYLCY